MRKNEERNEENENENEQEGNEGRRGEKKNEDILFSSCSSPCWTLTKNLPCYLFSLEFRTKLPKEGAMVP